MLAISVPVIEPGCILPVVTAFAPNLLDVTASLDNSLVVIVLLTNFSPIITFAAILDVIIALDAICTLPTWPAFKTIFVTVPLTPGE